MNIIFLIVCYIATAAANLGYSYQPARSVIKQTYQTPPPLISHNGIYSSQQAPPLPTFNVQLPPIPALAPHAVVPPQLFAQLVPPLVASPTLQTPLPQYNDQPQQATIISKDIYIHSSPEDTEEININEVAESIPSRQNYRIVFIKAPSQNIKFNVESLKRIQAANEEKTVIYVLSKKPDVVTIKNQLTTLQTEQKSHKPDVYFIKYKTQEEANRAQQEIQAQYDALGGSTHISDEGIAPITSVIGAAPVNTGSAGSILGSGIVNGPSLSSGTNFVASASNSQQQIAQSATNNQQNFIQKSFQSNHRVSPNINFAIQAPSTKYLPAKKL